MPVGAAGLALPVFVRRSFPLHLFETFSRVCNVGDRSGYGQRQRPAPRALQQPLGGVLKVRAEREERWWYFNNPYGG